MVFREGRQVVVAAPLNADERDLMRIDGLQLFAVGDGDQPVARAVDDVGMTGYLPDPFMNRQVVTQQPLHWQEGYKAFDHFVKIVVGCIEDQEAGVVVGSDLGCKPAPEAPSVYDDVLLYILHAQRIVYKLQVAQHACFVAFAGAFAKSTVIHQYHIIIVAVKIARILRPAFDAAGVAMKVQDQSLGLLAVKMQSVDPYTLLYLKIQFFERNIVFEFKISPQLFRLEDKFLLNEIEDNDERNIAIDDIEEDGVHRCKCT